MLYYVDHTSRFERNTGIQRCVRAIAKALLDLHVPLQPVVWDRHHQDFVLASPEALQHLSRWSGPDSAAWTLETPDLAEHAFGGWILIVELVSGPHNPDADQLRCVADRRGLQVAWVFHDAIPVLSRHLQGSGSDVHAYWHALYMQGLTRFERVLANSHASANDLLGFLIHQKPQLQLGENSLRVVRLADGISEVREKLVSLRSSSVMDADFILCVGSLEPRKNHRALLKALSWLVAIGGWPEGMKLMLVGWGQNSTVTEMVKRAQYLGLPVCWESDAIDDRLTDLYRNCLFTVYPSLAEGFGLPVAESLGYGKACLCSSKGALAELALDGGCWLVDVSDWRKLAIGLSELFRRGDLLSNLEKEAMERVPRSWLEYAKEVLYHLS